jgi:hypothetical protein
MKLDQLIADNEAQVAEAEALLVSLHKKNEVPQYLLEEKISVKKARALFCKCILQLLMQTQADMQCGYRYCSCQSAMCCYSVLICYSDK